MTKRMTAVAVLWLATVACGGNEPDYSSNFTGQWMGGGGYSALLPASSLPTQLPPLESFIGPLAITSVGYDKVHIPACADGDGPTARVTGPSSLSVDGFACAPQPDPTCGSSSVVFERGAGSVINGTLTVTVEGTCTWCGQSYACSYSFSGARS